MPQELVGSHAVRDLLPPANQRTQLAQAMSQERQAENLSRRVPLARSTPPCRCGRFDGTTYGAMPDSWQAGSKSPWNSAIHRRSGGPHRKRATRPQRVQEVRRAGAGHAAVGLPHARARGRIPSREVIDRVPVSPHGARRPQGCRHSPPAAGHRTHRHPPPSLQPTQDPAHRAVRDGLSFPAQQPPATHCPRPERSPADLARPRHGTCPAAAVASAAAGSPRREDRAPRADAPSAPGSAAGGPLPDHHRSCRPSGQTAPCDLESQKTSFRGFRSRSFFNSRTGAPFLLPSTSQLCLSLISNADPLMKRRPVHANRGTGVAGPSDGRRGHARAARRSSRDEGKCPGFL